MSALRVVARAGFPRQYSAAGCFRRRLRLAVEIEANLADDDWTSRRFDVEREDSGESGLPGYDADAGALDEDDSGAVILSAERFEHRSPPLLIDMRDPVVVPGSRHH